MWTRRTFCLTWSAATTVGVLTLGDRRAGASMRGEVVRGPGQLSRIPSLATVRHDLLRVLGFGVLGRLWVGSHLFSSGSTRTQDGTAARRRRGNSHEENSEDHAGSLAAPPAARSRFLALRTSS